MTTHTAKAEKQTKAGYKQQRLPSKAIREYMDAKNLNQREMAEKLGVSSASVCTWLRDGEAPVAAVKLVRGWLKKEKTITIQQATPVPTKIQLVTTDTKKLVVIRADQSLVPTIMNVVQAMGATAAEL